MRIATYNVEWFSNLFDRNGRMLEDGEWSSRYKVTRAEQLGALGIVFTAMDADLVMVIEAPDNNRQRQTVPMLESFAARYGLRQRKALLGFDSSLKIDLDVDAQLDLVTYSKPPLEVALQTREGRDLRLIGVHIKSKAPHGATTPEAATRLAIENRRKQLAQSIWLRRRVERHLDGGDSVIVLGDFNDGPGLDEYEKLFGRSSIEIVLGEGGPPERRLRDPHARLSSAHSTAASATSARFYNAEERQYFSAMLDYVMLSPDLCTAMPEWRIWHPFDDPACYRTPELREALLQASDHFPVSVDLSLCQGRVGAL